MNANMALLKCHVRKFLSLLSIFCSYPGNGFRNSKETRKRFPEFPLRGLGSSPPSLLRSVQGATAPPEASSLQKAHALRKCLRTLPSHTLF